MILHTSSDIASRVDSGYYGPSYLEQLISEVARGNRNALTDLYDHTVPQIMAVCRAMSDSSENIKQVVCDVYMYVWQHIGAYDPAKGSVMAWLCDLARRRVHDVERQHPSFENSRSAGHSGLHEALNPTVMRALDHLPPMRRRLIELAFIEGYSNPEIGERLSLPIDVVNLQLRRARAELYAEVLDLEARENHAAA